MTLRTLLVLALVPIAGAQKFEVASIKPCRVEAGEMRGAADSPQGRLNTGCDLLVDDNSLGLIQRAYVRFAGGRLNTFSIIPIKGGPRWLRTDMYRIDAKAEGDEGPAMLQGPMLQRLLEDRFKLKVHREATDGPVYALTVEDATRLKRFVDGTCAPPPTALPRPAPPSGQRYCKAMVVIRGGPAIEAEGVTIPEFAKLLNLILDRTTLDRTGLTGRFDLHVEFARDDATPNFPRPTPESPEAASDASRATIFTAIREQLGLKLSPSRGPVDVLVVDHVERPTEN